MTIDQIFVVLTLLTSLVLFAWGYWRHDIVAVFALLALVFLGVIPADKAYAGFGHPAVITVAAMLIISASLEETGMVDILARRIGTAVNADTMTLILLAGAVTVMSAFMNNVGALALMMPVTLAIAARKKISPSRLLMPVAFGSILGGLLTLIGTPPNIIIAAYRAEAVGSPFSLFDFAPAGIAVALTGLTATIVFSRFFLTRREGQGTSKSIEFVEAYLTEVMIPEGSPFNGKTIGDLEDLGQGDINILGIIRGDVTTVAPRASFRLMENDVLVMEADPASLQELLNVTGVELTGELHLESQDLGTTEGQLVEAVLMPRSLLEGQTLRQLRLHTRYGMNVLAVARKGETVRARLGSVRFQIGDLILVQGDARETNETLGRLGCLPVSGTNMESRNFSFFPLAVFAAGLLASALNLVPIHIALVAAAVTVVATRHLPLKRVYDSIDWAAIVLLAAMIPVGESLRATGATSLIASNILSLLEGTSGAVIIATLIVVAMVLSNVVNNAATAILMAPLSIEIARGLGFGPDPFLMAVAVGSSCAFILPIGHQSNLLVMGPGGYRFGDYWPLGTVVSLAVLCAAVPAILFVWPLINP